MRTRRGFVAVPIDHLPLSISRHTLFVARESTTIYRFGGAVLCSFTDISLRVSGTVRSRTDGVAMIRGLGSGARPERPVHWKGSRARTNGWDDCLSDNRAHDEIEPLVMEVRII